MFLDGWWMDGWVGVKAVSRIAYSNQNDIFYGKNNYNWFIHSSKFKRLHFRKKMLKTISDILSKQENQNIISANMH